jgi:FMN reductase
MTDLPLDVVAIDGSPTGSGRTAMVIADVLKGAGLAPEAAVVHSLADPDIDVTVDAVDRAELVVVGSPTYRASFSAPLKAWFDQLPRGPHPQDRSPLAGKPVAVVMTGGSPHHFLAQDGLVALLSVTFAALVVPPGLYVTPADGDPSGGLREVTRDAARDLGRRSADLARLLRPGTWRSIRPQI